MLIIRFLFVISALAIVLSGGMYLLTNNPSYLRLAWQVARFVIFAFLIVALLYILERFSLMGWIKTLCCGYRLLINRCRACFSGESDSLSAKSSIFCFP